MTELAATERALTTALDTIRDNWDALLEPTGSGGVASKPVPRSLYTRDDHDERDDDLPNLDRRIALRHDVTAILNSWARVIVDDQRIKPWNRCDHGVTITLKWPNVGPTRTRCAARIEWARDKHGTHHGLHAVLGEDALGLCDLIERHARWFSGHEAATDAADELTAWAGRVQAAASPQRRDWMPLGTCPLEIETDGSATVCAGQVRAHPGREPECHKCGTTGSADWWERVMFPDAETSALVTADDLVLVLHRAFGGTPIKPTTIRQWISRKVIESSGKDDQGRTLFNRAYVVRTLAGRLGA